MVAVAAVPTMPAISRDGMNTAAAEAMHAIRAAEKPRSSPRDDRRPNRTRLAEAAWAVSVMAFALCDSWMVKNVWVLRCPCGVGLFPDG
jgi:hypothetical protein